MPFTHHSLRTLKFADVQVLLPAELYASASDLDVDNAVSAKD